MIVFINGAFGIGKTTVARELVARLPDSLLFDPELVGIPLQRLARVFRRRIVDFQDLPVWRRLTVTGLRGARRIAKNVIVPMSFSEPSYLEEVVRGARRVDAATHHFCLVAPEAVVHERLRKRGADPTKNAWEFRRASECCSVHGDATFGTHVPAAERSAEALAADILRRINRFPASESRARD